MKDLIQMGQGDINMCYGPYEEDEPFVCPVCGRTYWNDSEHECQDVE